MIKLNTKGDWTKVIIAVIIVFAVIFAFYLVDMWLDLGIFEGLGGIGGGTAATTSGGETTPENGGTDIGSLIGIIVLIVVVGVIIGIFVKGIAKPVGERIARGGGQAPPAYAPPPVPVPPAPAPTPQEEGKVEILLGEENISHSRGAAGGYVTEHPIPAGANDFKFKHIILRNYTDADIKVNKLIFTHPDNSTEEVPLEDTNLPDNGIIPKDGGGFENIVVEVKVKSARRPYEIKCKVDYDNV